MVDKIHLIMPMGGKGSRFAKYGFAYPKPLIELNGKPFFYWSVRSIQKFVELQSLVFVVLKEHVEGYSIDKAIRNYFPNSVIHVIPEVLNGAVLTCMEGTKEIHDGSPILFNDCDHLFRSSEFNEFCRKGKYAEIDAALLTFNSSVDKYSYVQIDSNNNIIRTEEKKVISNDAICGAYYFKNISVFLKAADKYLKQCNYKEYFVSGIYNILANEGMIIKKFETDYHIPFGVPEEYEEAKSSERFDDLE